MTPAPQKQNTPLLPDPATIRSWKTTLSGYITSGAMLIGALHIAGVKLPLWLVVTSAFVAAGGIAGLGRNSKDFNVTGAVAPPSKDTATK